jgi:hypothetical protein
MLFVAAHRARAIRRVIFDMFISASELTASPGKSGHLGPLVAKMRDVLGNETGKDWWAWAVLAGRPYGSFVISTRFDDYTDMVTSQMKVAASTDWAALAATAEGVLAQPAPSTLSEVIAVTGEPSAPKQFALVTRAVIDRSAMMDAISWSTQVAEYVTKVTGVSTTVAASAAGKMFEVSWLASVDTSEELDKMSAINADAGYLEMLATAGANKLFEQGMSERMLLAKLP